MRKTALAALLVIAAAGLAQRGRFGLREADDAQMPPRNAEFHFLRVQYTDLPEYHRGWGYSSRDGTGSGWWLVDWPAADNHFTTGLARLTRIDAGDPRYLRLTDDRLFDYPWIYATQTGWWGLSDAETGRLREYLMRGGFLVVDDFWGPEQWELFRETMNRVLPNHPILDIADSRIRTRLSSPAPAISGVAPTERSRSCSRQEPGRPGARSTMTTIAWWSR